MWDVNAGYRNSSSEDTGTSSMVAGRGRRTTAEDQSKGIGTGVQGRGLGDITTVDRMKGKGPRGETSQSHWELSKGSHLGTLGMTQRRSQGGDV